MNTTDQETTLTELGARVSADAADTAAAMAAATELMRRAGEEAQEAQEAHDAMATAIGRLKPYAAPMSDRPSGAARKRLRWSELAERSHEWRRRRLLGADPTPPKAGIARGRQGVKRG